MHRRTLQYINFLFLFAFLSSCTISITNNGGTIEATINGLGNDSILVECNPLSNYYKYSDSHQRVLVAKDNKFEYKSPFEVASLVYISPRKTTFPKKDGSRFAPSYIFALIKPSDKLIIKGTLKKYIIDYDIKGSEFNEEYSIVRKEYLKDMEESIKYDIIIDSLHFHKAKREELIKQYENRNNKIVSVNNKKLKFIKGNPNSEVAAFFLYNQQLDTIGKYLPLLSKKVRNGLFKEILNESFKEYKRHQIINDAAKKVIPGTLAPTFSLNNNNDEIKMLSDYKYEYLVLEFWGSWCHWCIKGYPKMKTYYKKHKGKLEYLGIACNDEEEAWKKAISDNELNWPQLINSNDEKNDLILLYGIRGYPTKIILDKNQKIIARFIGETPKFYKKLDELLNK
jgi:thiol-disulfide isomerase/thioredoxin